MTPAPADRMPACRSRCDAGHDALRVDGLRKNYGATVAVDGISFGVRAGEIVGLLGPNGAGKTTTINMVLGVLQPSAGDIRIEGIDLARHRSQALWRTPTSPRSTPRCRAT